MSKVVTPPDIVNEPPVYLIVNAPVVDIEILSNWLRIEENNYTLHLYHDGMNDSEWLTEIAKSSKTILIHKPTSTAKSLEPVLDYVNKIVWFGDSTQYIKAIDYFLKNHGITKS